MLGKRGTVTAMKTFDMSRPGEVLRLWYCTGRARSAIAYSRQRRQFGAPISSFQGLRFMLVDMAMKVEMLERLFIPLPDDRPGIT